MLRNISMLVLLAASVGLLVARPADATDASVIYELGSCSRVVHACGGCAEPDSEPLGGAFTLTRGPLQGEESDVETFLVEDLTLRNESVEASGLGVLIISGDRASFLGSLVVEGRKQFVGGSGSVGGTFPYAVHIDHLLLDGMRFEIYATPGIYSDEDGDLVPDPDDLCHQTTCGASVNATGCAIEQLCPCAARVDGEPWGAHRQYVRCIIAESRELLVAGQLDARSRTALVKEATHSICGRSILAQLDPAPGLR
jgi:hypothetical protein